MESVDVDGFFEIKNRIRDLDLSALENRLDLRSVKAKHGIREYKKWLEIKIYDELTLLIVMQYVAT